MMLVNSLKMHPKSITLQCGSGYCDAWVEVCPEQTTGIDVSWYSDDPDVAKVDELRGLIYAVDQGTTRIYAQATDGSGKRDYLTVTVVGPWKSWK